MSAPWWAVFTYLFWDGISCCWASPQAPSRAAADLELLNLLPPFPMCWDYREIQYRNHTQDWYTIWKSLQGSSLSSVPHWTLLITIASFPPSCLPFFPSKWAPLWPSTIYFLCPFQLWFLLNQVIRFCILGLFVCLCNTVCFSVSKRLTGFLVGKPCLPLWLLEMALASLSFAFPFVF